ncbi:MAG: PAS domain S-box protein, partial [Acidimicrobiales bacterium]
EVSSTPIDRGGRPAVLSVVRDVSERLERDAELLEVQQRHSLSFDNAPIGQGLLGLDGTWLAVNQALCDLLGRSAAELRGANFQDLTHPDDLDTDRGLMEQLVAGAIPNYSLEKRYLRPDGTVVWAALHRSLVRDQTGRPLYFVSQIADVTAIKARERALAAAEARWWTAFDGAPVGMGELDLSGGILQANDALADLLGQPSGQLEGGRLVDHLHPDERPAVAARLAAIAGGEPGRGISERRLLPSGSGERWVSIRAGRIHGTRDSPDRVLVHVLDVTAEHQQRERRDAAYARFSALVEHSSDAITVIDADGIVRYASPAFATLTGARTTDPTIGTRVDAQVHPEDLGAVHRIARSLLAEDGRTVTFECRLHHRTNGWRNVDVTATNRLREPAVHGIVVNARDITERVEAAARLAHQAMHD